MLSTWTFLGHELNPICGLGSAGFFNSPCQAGYQTCASITTWATAVRFLTHCTTVGTPIFYIFNIPFKYYLVQVHKTFDFVSFLLHAFFFKKKEILKYYSQILFFSFLGLHLQHMEVPRLGIQVELQLLAYTTDMVMHHVLHSSQQWQILNTLSEPKNWTHILLDASCVHNPLSHNGNSTPRFLIIHILILRTDKNSFVLFKRIMYEIWGWKLGISSGNLWYVT